MLCNRCSVFSRIEGSHFCEACAAYCASCHNAPKAKASAYCKDCKRSYMEAWRKLNPAAEELRIKNNARAYAKVYLRRGHLQRGPCEVPGCAERAEMHHDDYTKPLEVRWLCREHHAMWHAEHGYIDANPQPENAQRPKPSMPRRPRRKCSRCGEAPAAHRKQLCLDCIDICPQCNQNKKGEKHRWCPPCRAAYERKRRAARSVLTRAALHVLTS